MNWGVINELLFKKCIHYVLIFFLYILWINVCLWIICWLLFRNIKPGKTVNRKTWYTAPCHTHTGTRYLSTLNLMKALQSRAALQWYRQKRYRQGPNFDISNNFCTISLPTQRLSIVEMRFLLHERARKKLHDALVTEFWISA